jgi:2-C-methyl-D-erythritol 4-phosphate cytidylyltransferase / 2-C-methyl-D-erythritol 2,4-cyclodiphosphate synthase
MKNIKNKNLVTIILASGIGQRVKKSIPKQYLTLNNKTLLEININKFLSLEINNKIIVVINKNHKNYYKNLLKKYNNIDFMYGGDSRQKSSLNALRFLEKKGFEYVAIHDAARPFFSKKLIYRLYSNILKNKLAVIPVIKVNNSIKKCNKNHVINSIDRKDIFLSQTPQIFNFNKLIKAYNNFKNNLSEYTDDSQIFEANGNKVFTVVGDIENVKITTKDDWLMQKNKYESNYTICVGQGYDVHKLIPGKYIKLFGVKIPFNFSLLGHSDADVGVHAIMDALLGAISGGDIGKIYPDTDNKNKNRNSLIMLKKINQIIKNNNASINHIDCTLIGEKPKISKYTKKMRLNISETLNLDINSVSIKATTTEGLGFTGRKEGLACMCNATVKKIILKENEI